ncbi:MAG: UDP-N-acetylmuramate--L-alanine ligase [Chloroflexota bacterium]
MKRFHLIGIGGAGLSAIARVLLEQGHVVTGSDQRSSPPLESLSEAGAQVWIGHQAEQVHGADVVIRSSAILDENVEVIAAQQRGIPVLKRDAFMRELTSEHYTIAVAGTHGKTTTTAMIAWILSSLGQQPSFIVGGVVNNLGTNAHAGKGQYFVVEADEYDYMFFGLNPQIAVVTNVEHDHPDCFPSSDDFYAAFQGFASRVADGGVLLACADDAGAARLLGEAQTENRKTLSYGLEATWSDYRADELALQPNGCFGFNAYYDGSFLDRVLLQVPGKHNVTNALAALAVAHYIELPIGKVARTLKDFRGAGRRFEVCGEEGGVTVINDYAHHPTEIRATIAAARSRYPGRDLWVVWQPHTYSRTRTFFHEFATAFGEAHHVVVTEVYPAREAVQPDFSSQEVVRAMVNPEAFFIPTLDETTAFLLERLKDRDVLLVLSAGDADQVGYRLLQGLRKRRRGLQVEID